MPFVPAARNLPFGELYPAPSLHRASTCQTPEYLQLVPCTTIPIVAQRMTARNSALPVFGLRNKAESPVKTALQEHSALPKVLTMNVPASPASQGFGRLPAQSSVRPVLPVPFPSQVERTCAPSAR